MSEESQKRMLRRPYFARPPQHPFLEKAQQGEPLVTRLGFPE